MLTVGNWVDQISQLNRVSSFAKCLVRWPILGGHGNGMTNDGHFIGATQLTPVAKHMRSVVRMYRAEPGPQKGVPPVEIDYQTDRCIAGSLARASFFRFLDAL